MRAMRFALVPFLLLLVIPIAEIATFIAVGGAIGIGWTLLLILITAIIGTALLRAQGMGLVARIQSEVRAGRVPARELTHGLMLLLAGVLLLTPGFVTDAVGFSLFVPPVRDLVWRLARERVTVRMRSGLAGAAMGGTVGAGARGGPFGPNGSRGPFAPRSGTIDLDEDDYRRTDPPTDGTAAPIDGAAPLAHGRPQGPRPDGASRG